MASAADNNKYMSKEDLYAHLKVDGETTLKNYFNVEISLKRRAIITFIVVSAIATTAIAGGAYLGFHQASQGLHSLNSMSTFGGYVALGLVGTVILGFAVRYLYMRKADLKKLQEQRKEIQNKEMPREEVMRILKDQTKMDVAEDATKIVRECEPELFGEIVEMLDKELHANPELVGGKSMREALLTREGDLVTHIDEKRVETISDEMLTFLLAKAQTDELYQVLIVEAQKRLEKPEVVAAALSNVDRLDNCDVSALIPAFKREMAEKIQDQGILEKLFVQLTKEKDVQSQGTIEEEVESGEEAAYEAKTVEILSSRNDFSQIVSRITEVDVLTPVVNYVSSQIMSRNEQLKPVVREIAEKEGLLKEISPEDYKTWNSILLAEMITKAKDADLLADLILAVQDRHEDTIIMNAVFRRAEMVGSNQAIDPSTWKASFKAAMIKKNDQKMASKLIESISTDEGDEIKEAIVQVCNDIAGVKIENLPPRYLAAIAANTKNKVIFNKVVACQIKKVNVAGFDIVSDEIAKRPGMLAGSPLPTVKDDSPEAQWFRLAIKNRKDLLIQDPVGLARLCNKGSSHGEDVYNYIKAMEKGNQQTFINQLNTSSAQVLLKHAYDSGNYDVINMASGEQILSMLEAHVKHKDILDNFVDVFSDNKHEFPLKKFVRNLDQVAYNALYKALQEKMNNKKLDAHEDIMKAIENDSKFRILPTR